MVRIFALGAEFLIAIFTEEATIIALPLFANAAIAEVMPHREVVTAPAPILANLEHFAVCALPFGTSWQSLPNLSKSRSMVFAKTTT